MRNFIILFILFVSNSTFGQTDSLNKGAKWIYDYPYARIEADSSGNKILVYSPNIREFQFYEGLAKVQLNKHIGFVDTNKIIVIPIVYDYVASNKFKDSRAIVKLNDEYGVIDKSGYPVIPIEYDYISQEDSLFKLKIEYDWGYSDKNGNIILPLGKHNRKCQSCKITLDEINALAEIYYVKDSLEKSVNISKEQAIKIAKRKGYYWEGEFPFDAKIILESGQWEIICSKYDGVSNKGNCRYTNGCTVIIKSCIIIDAFNGNIIKKSKSKEVGANYE